MVQKKASVTINAHIIIVTVIINHDIDAMLLPLAAGCMLLLYLVEARHSESGKKEDKKKKGTSDSLRGTMIPVAFSISNLFSCARNPTTIQF